MGRLIDADLLKEAFGFLNDEENIDRHFKNGLETARELVDNQPTAYDVEMVVEQLEKNREVFESRNIIPCVNMDYAVRVVRKGGVE